MKDKKNKWVEFLRLPCLEGYIDMWRGDCAQNPNNETRLGYNLNSFATYFRLSGTLEWVRDRQFNCNFYIFIRNNMDEMTANVIWAECLMPAEYYYLKHGEIIQEGDECEISNSIHDPAKWVPAVNTIGQAAPDPAYPSHRKYRRLISA